MAKLIAIFNSKCVDREMLDFQHDDASAYFEIRSKACTGYSSPMQRGTGELREFTRAIFAKFNIFIASYRVDRFEIDMERRALLMHALMGAHVRKQLKPGPEFMFFLPESK